MNHSFIFWSVIIFCFQIPLYAQSTEEIDLLKNLVVKIYNKNSSTPYTGIIIGNVDSIFYVLTATHAIKDNDEVRINFFQQFETVGRVHQELKDPEANLDFTIIKGIVPSNSEIINDLNPIRAVNEFHSFPDAIYYIIGHPKGSNWIVTKHFLFDSLYLNDLRKIQLVNDEGGVSLGSSGSPVFDEAFQLIGIVTDYSGQVVVVNIREILNLINFKHWSVRSNLILYPKVIHVDYYSKAGILKDSVNFESDEYAMSADDVISSSNRKKFIGINIDKPIVDSTYEFKNDKYFIGMLIEKKAIFKYPLKAISWVPSLVYFYTLQKKMSNKTDYEVEDSDKWKIYAGVVVLPALAFAAYRTALTLFSGESSSTPFISDQWEYEFGFATLLLITADLVLGYPKWKLDMFTLVKEIPVIHEPPTLPLINLKFRF